MQNLERSYDELAAFSCSSIAERRGKESRKFGYKNFECTDMKSVLDIKGFNFAAGEGCRQRCMESMIYIPIQSLGDMSQLDSTLTI